MTLSRKDVFFISGLALVLFIFYPDLFLAKRAILAADHIEQHYPWTSLLAESVKHFRLPFWTNLIQCGFPISAEGQIGVFYLPNLLLCFLLPVDWAYSYLFVIHFFLSGLGTYLYCRQMRLNELASFVSACIFLFGAAFGGAYYNITSLKTLCWFPFMLLFFERFYQQNEKKSLLGLAIVISFSLLAGYLQIAVFALFIFMIYIFLRLIAIREHTTRLSIDKNLLGKIVWIGIFCGIGFVLAFPQIYLTYRLAIQSNRIGLDESFAYVGSMAPGSVLTLIFPVLQRAFKNNCIYSGIVSIFFIICTLCLKKYREENLFKLWITMGIVSLLLALGQWSPLYIVIVKLTHFYSFRIPAKFLFFTCFSLAILSGTGLQSLLSLKKSHDEAFLISRINKIYFATITSAIAIMLTVSFLIQCGNRIWLKIGKILVERLIFNHAGHPHSLEFYLDQLVGYLSNLQSLFSLSHTENFYQLYFVALSVIFVLILSKIKKLKMLWLCSFLIFGVIDLSHYSWLDIRRGFDSFQNVKKQIYENRPQSHKIVEKLLSEKKDNKLSRLYGFRNLHEYLPITPSNNMLENIEDIGAYSPFVFRRYYETIGQFGNINDSNNAADPTPKFVFERFPLLAFLDVSHILSRRPLENSQITLLEYDENLTTYLYKTTHKHGRTYIINHMEVFADWESLKRRLMAHNFDPRQIVLFEKSEMNKISNRQFAPASNTIGTISLKAKDSTKELWEIEVNGPCFFVTSNTMFAGWQAKINGNQEPILLANGLFRSVSINKAGKYEIEFEYHPFGS
jgi:hypothetical protein